MFDTFDTILLVVMLILAVIFAKWHFQVSFAKIITFPIYLCVQIGAFLILAVLMLVCLFLGGTGGFIQYALSEWGMYSGENIWDTCPANPWNTENPWFGKKES